MKRKWQSIFMVLATMILLPSITMFCWPTSSMAQGLREFTCEVFECQPFKDLVALVGGIPPAVADVKTDTDAILTETGYITANTTSLNHDLQRVEDKIDALSIPPGAEYEDELFRIETKLNYIMKAESSIWMEDYRDTSGNLFIEIWIKGESLREMVAWGLDLNFPDAAADYGSITPGDLVAGWNSVDANELNPGQLRIGAFAGSGSPIVGTAIGKLCIVRLNNLGPDNFVILLNSYVDDVGDMLPNPASRAIIIN